MASLRASTKVEDGGRIVIPEEMRRALGLKKGDSVDLEMEGTELRIVAGTERHGRVVTYSIEEMKSSAEEAWVEEAMAEEAAMRDQS